MFTVTMDHLILAAMAVSYLVCCAYLVGLQRGRDDRYAWKLRALDAEERLERHGLLEDPRWR